MIVIRNAAKKDAAMKTFFRVIKNIYVNLSCLVIATREKQVEYCFLSRFLIKMLVEPLEYALVPQLRILRLQYPVAFVRVYDQL